MDVRLSPEQRALGDSVSQLGRRLGPGTVGALGDRERAAKLEAAVDAAGWRELRQPGPDGRPWASGVEVAIVAEQLGRCLCDVAYIGPTLAADLRRLAGIPASDQRETVVLTTDLSRPASAGGVAIDAAEARSALCLQEGTVASVGLAPGDSSGPDLTRPCTPVPAGGSSLGVYLLDDDLARWTALGLAASCADLVGVMGGALELSVAYAKDRSQFGQPIGSFQAVQHLLADALVHVEGSRSIMLHAAWAVDALPSSEALGAASAAKAYCARAAVAVCETAVQVHGGIGNTWDCLAHVYLRRALFSADLLGGIGDNLARVLDAHQLGNDGRLR